MSRPEASAAHQSHPFGYTLRLFLRTLRRIASVAVTCLLSPVTCLLLALTSPPLSAHDIYTSWTEVHVRNERLELTLTVARGAALRFIANSNTLPPITPDNFSDYAPRLKTAAPGLFEISSAGKPVKLLAAEVKISGDADVTFHLAFTRPPAGPLRFVAPYLFQLVDGHVGTLIVNDAAGKDLGWSPVSVDQPSFELKIPPATTRKP